MSDSVTIRQLVEGRKQHTIRDIAAERVRREKLRRKARGNFLDFTRYTMPAYEVNWHHRALADKLDWWVRTPNAKLIVCMPPRMGKSELVSRRLPAYVLGNNPNADIIATSYGQDLANAMSRDVQSIMDGPEYLSLFPGSRRPFRAREKKLSTINDWQLAYRDGSYKAAGVGGGITGRGFDFGIIDDPFKNDAEAQSPRQREKVWYWYHSTFLTRREPGARILITMTRWHQSDLVGMLVDSEDDWEIISLPAVKEEAPTIPEDKREVGEYLWESRFGPDKLEATKAITRVWNAAYRQQPSEGEGNVYKKNMFSRYTSLPVGDDGFVEYLLSIDATFKGTAASSRVSMSLWGRTRTQDYYLLDEECAQMGFLATLDRAKNIIERWPETKGMLVILIEDKANGPAIIEAMGKTLPNIIAINPRESKEARAQAVLPAFVSGHVHFPADSYMVRDAVAARTWIVEFIVELLEFPYYRFNDRVDSTSQALLYFIENSWELNFGRAGGFDDDDDDDDDGEVVFGMGSLGDGDTEWNPF